MSGTPSNPVVRVASIPHDQIYIRHLEAVDSSGAEVFRLPDPPPVDGMRSAQSGWWPPAMLSADWVRANHDSFDLMHIHFGFDAADPAHLRELVAELRHFGKPLVYTVHDLVNPHQPDPAAHVELLDVLIPHADKLITLTAGAAREIRRRWGAEAQVLPHPHVVDFGTMDRIRAARRRKAAIGNKDGMKRIGVHLKGLRPNMDTAILDPLARAVARLPSAVLQVNIHSQPLDPASDEYRPALAGKLHDGANLGLWELRSHEYFSEPELFDYLASLDACVLPYRFGTHSGWLEAAIDVGTPVVAPDCGHYADQDPSVGRFRTTPTGADEESLLNAIREVLRAEDLPGLDAEGRRRQRLEIARAHRELYDLLLDRTPAAR
ncbi:glycosyltransferase [Paeniglutamicibacter sulfureus]|uniref:Glycosyltransferase involved in cell wall biosynthesis n=1 Tax=Paeniglutamicibacter sulfureus TaxID=43666 RepID=A0ABU2BSB7_9MICC|nr:glycosyltransferase [Paeniglutamicibacter sulfureus]MDR7360259.1 glycosyltransferase involved in cell wall biosynthesis [Paeniglutamicibacter sulfureus]